MSRVFVVQNQHHWDKTANALVPKFDLTPAEQYGELVFLLGSNAAPWNSESIVPQLRAGLEDFTDEDYLLLVGNPCLIGWSVAIAADVNDGYVRLLQWSGRDRSYIPVAADLYP